MVGDQRGHADAEIDVEAVPEFLGDASDDAIALGGFSLLAGCRESGHKTSVSSFQFPVHQAASRRRNCVSASSKSAYEARASAFDSAQYFDAVVSNAPNESAMPPMACS